jgi:hypothetical protein
VENATDIGIGCIRPPDVFDFVGWLLVVGSGAAAFGTVGLVWFLYRHQRGAGPRWFIGALGAQALWTASYTVGLFIYDPVW